MKNLILFAFIVSCIFIPECTPEDNDPEPTIKYEKILGLALTSFGNSMIVYSGGTNTYDLVFVNDGTYTKKRWSDKVTVSGTWNVSGNDITMNETNGPVYTLTANAEGIVKDGMAVYINGESGNIAGLFNELIGTGSGVLDMAYTDAIGRYKVELLGDVASIVLTLNDTKLNINRKLLSGTLLEDNNYEWYWDLSDIIFTKTGTSGTPQDISKVDETWWVEGTPINLYFISDASYVGYMVTNIDYLGE